MTPTDAERVIGEIGKGNGAEPNRKTTCIRNGGSDQSFICSIVTAGGYRGQSQLDCDSNKVGSQCINRPLSDVQQPVP
jgi:hypothetical protein